MRHRFAGSGILVSKSGFRVVPLVLKGVAGPRAVRPERTQNMKYTATPEQARSDPAASRQSSEFDDVTQTSDGLAHVVRGPTLLQFLEHQSHRARSGGGAAPLAGWVVLDEFSQHRDQLGLSGLERLMHAIHERLRVQLEGHDLCARFGLDAIALVLDPGGGDRDVEHDLNALLRAISANLFEIGDHMVAATISIAIRRVHDDSRKAETALVRAARAAEQLSARGGNRFETASAAPEDGDLPSTLLTQLTRALNEDTLKVVFQPLLAVSGAERERAQLLPRLTGADGNLIPAARFIPVAAERGILPRLDRWMIDHALHMVAERASASEPLPQYFLNQSAALIDDAKLLKWLRGRVADVPGTAAGLALEFNILELKPRIRRARTVLQTLRDLGVSVTLSGVDEKVPESVMLHHLPADYLRMKADFARRLVSDNGLADRFQRFALRAREAGRQLIVPMLEDAEEVSRIWQMDVDLIQGNFIQQPTEQPKAD